MHVESFGGSGLQVAQEHVHRSVGVIGHEIAGERREHDIASAGGQL